MKRYLTLKVGKIIVYTGAFMMTAGFFINVLTLFNTYGKADIGSSCTNTPCNVDLSSNDRLVHLGSALIVAGIATIAIASIFLIYLQIQSHKHASTKDKKTP